MAPSKRVAACSKSPLTANSNAQNWNREGEKGRGGKGTRPLPEPLSIKDAMLMLLLHICRKVIFIEIPYKIAFYTIIIMIGSILCDFFPLPRGYFSHKNNFFNVYFVKLGMAWTILFLGAFSVLTSLIYCCGDKRKVGKHTTRLLVAVVCWYVWTTIFGWIESATGICSNKTEKFYGKISCLKNGHRWYGFDISGHAFLLIYCNLLIMEEVKPMVCWEKIKELIRNEEYDDDSPLKCLSEEQMMNLKAAYCEFGRIVKLLFIAITGLSLLWDFMLTCTVLFFHSMAQKFAGGLIAVITWMLTYQFWYQLAFSPGLPGQGSFRYSDLKPTSQRLKYARQASLNNSFDRN